MTEEKVEVLQGGMGIYESHIRWIDTLTGDGSHRKYQKAGRPGEPGDILRNTSTLELVYCRTVSIGGGRVKHISEPR